MRLVKQGKNVISIHAPPRGATFLRYVTVSMDVFQFTPLREGRLDVRQQPQQLLAFQFTPLREGRHLTVEDCEYLTKISIHAPPRGATYLTAAACLALSISIHVPPRGATEEIEEAKQDMKFQFTPLREGRRLLVEDCEYLDKISIHAPPRGAT